MDVAAYLKSVPLFQRLSAEAADKLAAETREESFPAQTKIVRRGEAGDCMYLLVEGKVQIPVYNRSGDQLYVAQLGPKQIFGEMALLTGEARSADVIAAVECRCLVFPRAAFERLIHRNGDVAQLLTAILGERLVSSWTIRKVGKYKLVGELGQGRRSIVYSGVHPTLERPVAIKMLLHRVAYRPRFRQRFQNEARIISRLHHPNIVEVYDTEEAYATFFIIMEQFDGEPLDALLRRGERPTFKQVRSILRQTASALSYAHDHGIVHRDIRPSNIVLGAKGEVKLTDFGLALDVAGGASEEDEDLLGSGSPTYMAPEQLRGEPVDARTDIYSLGVVAYELLTGAPPFEGKGYEIHGLQRTNPIPSPCHRNPDVPEDLERFVLRAAERVPVKRYQDCAEIVELFTKRGDSSALRIKTLTFIYDQTKDQEVERVLDDLKRRVAAIDGLEIR